MASDNYLVEYPELQKQAQRFIRLAARFGHKATTKFKPFNDYDVDFDGFHMNIHATVDEIKSVTDEEAEYTVKFEHTLHHESVDPRMPILPRASADALYKWLKAHYDGTFDRQLDDLEKEVAESGTLLFSSAERRCYHLKGTDAFATFHLQTLKHVRIGSMRGGFKTAPPRFRVHLTRLINEGKIVSA